MDNVNESEFGKINKLVFVETRLINSLIVADIYKSHTDHYKDKYFVRCPILDITTSGDSIERILSNIQQVITNKQFSREFDRDWKIGKYIQGSEIKCFSKETLAKMG